MVVASGSRDECTTGYSAREKRLARLKIDCGQAPFLNQRLSRPQHLNAPGPETRTPLKYTDLVGSNRAGDPRLQIARVKAIAAHLVAWHSLMIEKRGNVSSISKRSVTQTVDDWAGITTTRAPDLTSKFRVATPFCHQMIETGWPKGSRSRCGADRPSAADARPLRYLGHGFIAGMWTSPRNYTRDRYQVATSRNSIFRHISDGIVASRGWSTSPATARRYRDSRCSSRGCRSSHSSSIFFFLSRSCAPSPSVSPSSATSVVQACCGSRSRSDLPS